MNIYVRALTTAEQVAVEAVYGGSPLPAWGAVVHMDFGDVLLFDGADHRRRYTLIAGPDAPDLIKRINQAPYSSPDAGLIALLEDMTIRGGQLLQTAESLLPLVLIVGLIFLLRSQK